VAVPGHIISSGIDSSSNELGDQDVYLNTTAGLVDFINAGYDEIATMLEGMSDESFREEGMLFGSMPKAKWQIIRTAHEHGVWTLGQTVPYLRMHGATPPGYNVITG